MKIYPIETGNFKLDGGAMFGVVPKSLWQKTNPADSNNMCSWALRCMLIEDGNRLILIDNGMGDKQSDKFFGYYYLFGDDSLMSSIKKLGFHPDDITDVFLTHLHFDHCGGGIKWNADRTNYEATFKNATYWSNKKHWKWATQPNDREKASFLKENILPMKELGQLKFVEEEPFDLFDLFYADGHTDAMMIPIINYQGKRLAFMADLLPSAGHIPMPYVMGYDTRPLLTLEDRKRFYKKAIDENLYLFLEHDYQNEVITLKDTEKGARLDVSVKFGELFS
ncbi:MAG: MBL fold metallo-hydrolase [Bacteroidetes bacterium]|nr:MAG: MBL fold metallo-hydrolase [Bacteroidota bacterium]MBL1144936.1 MBL fold metallo-hydrolase [Bacteroidota bacterium]MCB0803790.1 MBL fold metallo-hydrolase [Flavobacteriales bacterium]NOG57730.1 MBL fold metallo-hydrolase [Bacteroidota bacterium]